MVLNEWGYQYWKWQLVPKEKHCFFSYWEGNCKKLCLGCQHHRLPWRSNLRQIHFKGFIKANIWTWLIYQLNILTPLAWFPWMPECKVNSDGSSEAIGNRWIDHRDQSGPKVGLDWSLRVHVPWIRCLRSPEILLSEEITLKVWASVSLGLLSVVTLNSGICRSFAGSAVDTTSMNSVGMDTFGSGGLERAWEDSFEWLRTRCTGNVYGWGGYLFRNGVVPVF